LAYCRLVKDGVAEDAINDIVLPYVNSAFKRDNAAYLIEMQSYGRKRVSEITEAAAKIPAKDLPQFLTEENKKTADYVLNKTKDYLSDVMRDSFAYSKLSFTMDKNL